ncbi:MAG: hypothetical protein NVS3B25_26880 [Hymenobacter sp.]
MAAGFLAPAAKAQTNYTAAPSLAPNRVQTANGPLDGSTAADEIQRQTFFSSTSSFPTEWHTLQLYVEQAATVPG